MRTAEDSDGCPSGKGMEAPAAKGAHVAAQVAVGLGSSNAVRSVIPIMAHEGTKSAPGRVQEPSQPKRDASAIGAEAVGYDFAEQVGRFEQEPFAAPGSWICA